MRKVLGIVLLMMFVLSTSGIADYADFGVFLSDAYIDGNIEYNGLHGIEGADAICQKEADDRGLPGGWKALLSGIVFSTNQNVNARDRLDRGLFYTIDNVNRTIANSITDLFDGSLDYRIKDRNTYSWTGSYSNGSSYKNRNCVHWTSNNSNHVGIRGYLFSSEEEWIINSEGGYDCSSKQHLYCFQTYGYDPEPQWKIFISGHAWKGRICYNKDDYSSQTVMCVDREDLVGIEAADTTCQREAWEAGLKGKYVALISDSSQLPYLNAADRVWDYGKFATTGGNLIAETKTQLFSGSILRAPHTFADGDGYVFSLSRMWTGSTSVGQQTLRDCNGWTSNSSGLYYDASYGRASQEGSDTVNWINVAGKYMNCANNGRVYCVQVPDGKKDCSDNVDNDGDGFYSKWYCQEDGKWDCDDTHSTAYLGATEICDGIDNDCDGQVDEGLSGLPELCDGLDNNCDGQVDEGLSGLPELCDGLDNNCDGSVDEGLDAWYWDKDNDDFGRNTNVQCEEPEPPLHGKYVQVSEDCNDDNIFINPNATEKCNGVDDDCDGETDEGCVIVTYYQDLDGDGYGTSISEQKEYKAEGYSGWAESTGDCNDLNVAVNPGVSEICNGVDDDCSNGPDDGLEFNDYFVDGDEDGFGKSLTQVTWCKIEIPGINYASVGGDCDDSDSGVNPNKAEICDGKDNNCDNIVDPGCCNNGELNVGEACDYKYGSYLSELSGWSCFDYSSSYVGGDLLCNVDCKSIDSSECLTQICGDGIPTGGEQCDGSNTRGRICADLGFDYGTVGCYDSDSDYSCKYDTSDCGRYTCGNGKLDSGEDCDGAIVGGDCSDLGYAKGNLGCKPNCDYDISQCVSVCGNNVKEIGEICDGSDVGIMTCEASSGIFIGGKLGCSNDCKKYDTSSCDRMICGDGVCSSNENCLADCNSVKKNNTPIIRIEESICGDGSLGKDESCDGEKLGGLDCSDFGFNSGKLSCNDQCKFDVAQCSFIETGQISNKQRLSDLIKSINDDIIQAKVDDKDTTEAESLFLEVIKDYASEDPDYVAIEAKLEDVQKLLEGGTMIEIDESISQYIIGIIILGLVLMLAFVLRGLGE
jgi:hypothetical protein